MIIDYKSLGSYEIINTQVIAILLHKFANTDAAKNTNSIPTHSYRLGFMPLLV